MNVAAITREFRELPLGSIDEPVLAARSTMSDERMDELVASIRSVGLLQPMIVARVRDRYEVIAGHRRRLACARAGLVAAPCIVYPSKEAFLEAIKFAENRHREELTPADEAIWFSELLERDAGGDVDTLAGLLGERRTYIESRLLLFSGDPDVFQALADAGSRSGRRPWSPRRRMCGLARAARRRRRFRRRITFAARCAIRPTTCMRCNP